MGEDVGVNGDRWNEKAISLLKQFHWEQIGDFNMDLTGSDDKSHGVDALLLCEDPNVNVPQPVILESKRYSKNSINSNIVHKWVDTLKNKINCCKDSQKLHEKFPILDDCAPINQGLIMCWIHDADAQVIENVYNYFETYNEKSGPSNNWGRIGFITNDKILQLYAIFKTVKNKPLIFYYPSQIINGRISTYSEVLSMNYIFSDIILAKQMDDDKHKYVFYFGEMDSKSLSLLHECLLLFQYVVKGENIDIYYWNHNEEFRKIEQNIKNDYEGVEVNFKTLDKCAINSELEID
jgi:hypothetical protein